MAATKKPRNSGSRRVGGGREIAKRDDKKNIRVEREYEQRSGTRRARVMEIEIKKRHDKTEVLEETDKYEGG